MQNSYPLISVIIPCYNHGNFLPDAINSVRNQTYKNFEIIIVDDGSIDHTRKIALSFIGIKYIFQQNQGLSSARNTGIANSVGQFLIFLDADDLLFSSALEYNLNLLSENPKLAFVSGGYIVTNIYNKKLGEKRKIVIDQNYINLLLENYIGMHATVMYRRFAFEEFLFDTKLKACEDYDLYLKISRKYPVAHHTKILANYRIHNNNMSSNIFLMLNSVLEVFERQRFKLNGREETKAFHKGISCVKKFYTMQIFIQLSTGKNLPYKKSLHMLWKNNKKLYYRYILLKWMKKYAKLTNIQKYLPEFGCRLLFKLGLFQSYVPTPNRINSGDFYRHSPFSKSFGYERGGPIDRYYIENFLQMESDSIKGRVLEIGDNEYTLRFGGKNVMISEIFHVNEGNPIATMIGDLSNAPQIPDNIFDCIILTQTLHLIYDYNSVIRTCNRILKPGGSLLLTVPGISPIDYGEWGKTWYWSFTGRAISKILSEKFSEDKTEVNTYGNVYTATSFLYGMGLPELDRKMLDHHDPQMQVIISAKALKNELV